MPALLSNFEVDNMPKARKVPINHFDRGKPFYPLVMNYLVQLMGHNEICLREVDQRLTRGFERYKKFGIALPHIKRSQKITVPSQGKVVEQKLATELSALRESVVELSDRREILLGPLRLRCDYNGKRIEINGDEIANDLVNNHTYIINFLMLAAGSLLILAYEICKTHNDQSSLWEFLRHCRNAAAHGGKFKLLHSEPRRPAQWGRFKIVNSLQGKSLFKEKDGKGLLSPGDPIRLLWDIEQAYPKIGG